MAGDGDGGYDTIAIVVLSGKPNEVNESLRRSPTPIKLSWGSSEIILKFTMILGHG